LYSTRIELALIGRNALVIPLKDAGLPTTLSDVHLTLLFNRRRGFSSDDLSSFSDAVTEYCTTLGKDSYVSRQLVGAWKVISSTGSWKNFVRGFAPSSVHFLKTSVSLMSS